MQIHDKPALKAEARNLNFYYGEAKVDGEVVAHAEVLCAGTRE